MSEERTIKVDGISTIVDNNEIRKRIESAVVQCVELTNNNWASQLNFKARKKQDSSGIIRYYLVVSGFKQKVSLHDLCFIAESTMAFGLMFDTKNQSFEFSYLDKRPKSRKASKPKSRTVESYISIAHRIGKIAGMFCI